MIEWYTGVLMELFEVALCPLPLFIIQCSIVSCQCSAVSCQCSRVSCQCSKVSCSFCACSHASRAVHENC